MRAGLDLLPTWALEQKAAAFSAPSITLVSLWLLYAITLHGFLIAGHVSRVSEPSGAMSMPACASSLSLTGIWFSS
jgi:hypothetical protein